MRPWLAVSCLLLCAHAIADDAIASGWQRFENGAFIAYSNADTDDALEVLEEFETIRSAALRIPRFFVPTDRPKTLLLSRRSRLLTQ